MKFIPFFIKRYIERIRVIAFGEKLREARILGYRKTKSLLNDMKYIIFLRNILHLHIIGV